MEFLSPEFIKVILNAGLSVVLALVVIYWYRCDSLDQLREEKERSYQERSDKILILDILKENTNALTNNSNAIEKVLEICNKINDKITRNQKDV